MNRLSSTRSLGDLHGPTGHDCVVCRSPIFGAEIRAPCGHRYDAQCVLGLFEAAVHDETLFPPKCCRQHIPLDSVRPYMGSSLLNQYKERTKESKTLKRIYCANPECSRFLGPLTEGTFQAWLRPTQRCPAPGCGTTTCTRCRARVEPHGHHCTVDELEAEVLALAKQAGWTRCPRCDQMIELYGGCFHMTCRCKAEFCYLCRAPWKTCSCSQWDHEHAELVANVWEDRVARAVSAHPAPGFRAYGPERRSSSRSASPRRSLALSEGSTAVSLGGPSETPTPTESPTDAPLTDSIPGAVSSDSSNETVRRSLDASSSDSISIAQGTEVSVADSSAPLLPSSSQRASVSGWLDRLQGGHDCGRHLRYCPGGGRCDRCEQNALPNVFRCIQCETLICDGCRKSGL